MVRAAVTCNDCKNIETSGNASSDSSHVYQKCHRFVSVQITALQTSPPVEKQPSLLQTKRPILPSKMPRSPKCNTCMAIPLFLTKEYLQFFEASLLCNQMPDIELAHLIAQEGQVQCVADAQGKVVLRLIKEFRDWYVSVAFNGCSMHRADSKKRVAESLTSNESAKLKRVGAIKRAGTASMHASIIRSGN